MATLTELAAAALSGGGLGSGLTRGLSWVANRGKTKAYTMGAVDHAVQTALASVTNEVARLNGEVDELRGQHKECERNLGDVNRRLDVSERERDAFRAKIDDLMSGPVAAIGQPPPPPD